MSEAIWHRAESELRRPVLSDVTEVLAAVRAVALELLESGSRPPQRLLLRAADVEVELDWRRPEPASVADLRVVPPINTAPANASPMNTAPVNLPVAVPDLAPGQHYVCAPSVGTFYRAAEPGGTPFVVEGALIRAQQTVGIVEAMKLMLPVEADRGGRIVEVLVPDGSSVEFGEQLFLVDDVRS
jgi:acetyl-CoA carboxylase biotin carboxyl carrier protein